MLSGMFQNVNFCIHMFVCVLQQHVRDQFVCLFVFLFQAEIMISIVVLIVWVDCGEVIVVIFTYNLNTILNSHQ